MEVWVSVCKKMFPPAIFLKYILANILVVVQWRYPQRVCSEITLASFKTNGGSQFWKCLIQNNTDVLRFCHWTVKLSIVLSSVVSDATWFPRQVSTIFNDRRYFVSLHA